MHPWIPVALKAAQDLAASSCDAACKQANTAALTEILVPSLLLTVLAFLFWWMYAIWRDSRKE